MAGTFYDPLEVEYIDGRRWKVTAEFDYHLGDVNGLETVHVPSGFVTDFASIPRLFWNLFPPTGSYGKAAVIHDWLYQKRIVRNGCYRFVERAEADAIFREAMRVLGVSWFTRQSLYLGVRAGGWLTWRSYRERNHI